MARPKKAGDSVPESGEQGKAEPAHAGFVLARNFGLHVRHAHKWWAAGTRFDPMADAALIAMLRQAGAAFED
jgi:hypothetical protein